MCPDSRLVLGKHSGRHALALRCEQLGHKFERRELDEIYRKFVILADRIKRVQDNHLIGLIQDAMIGTGIETGSAIKPSGAHSGDETAAKKIGPHAAPMMHFPRTVAATAAAAHESAPSPIPPSSVAIPFPDKRSDHEDYLWGV